MTVSVFYSFIPYCNVTKIINSIQILKIDDAEYNTYNRNSQPEGRYGIGGLKASLINTGLFNNRFPPANTWNPFSGLANKSPISINPNFESPISSFDACTSPNGESGICAPGNICALFGGRPSGSCLLGKVCCISKSP